MKSKKIMTHLVFGYPSVEVSLELIRRLDDEKVDYIEIQLPFSDPIADGPVLMMANEQASEYINTTDVLGMIANISFRHSKIMIMSYMHVFETIGLNNVTDFYNMTQNCTGIIIPDMPCDSVEYPLYASSLPIIPVISPGISRKRIAMYKKYSPNYCYITSQKSTTGTNNKRSIILNATCRAVKETIPQSDIMVGFGIRNKEDIVSLPELVSIAVIGTCLTEALQRGGVQEVIKEVKKLRI
jgi:tryptophan synthase alpha chain